MAFGHAKTMIAIMPTAPMTKDHEQKCPYMRIHSPLLTFANAFVDRRECFDRKVLNISAYDRLIKLKTHFRGVLHLMALDETDTLLFADMVSTPD
jgi:hypothetical protein